MMKKILSIIAAIAFSFSAWGQTSPGFTFGQVPTPGQWNSYFSQKMDFINPGSAGNIMFSNGTSWYSGPPSASSCSLLPGLTGDVTSSSGTCATTVGAITGHAASVGGSFTLSGAFSFTGNLANTTNITFPTSGTLASLSATQTWTGPQTINTLSTVAPPYYDDSASVVTSDFVHVTNLNQFRTVPLSNVTGGTYNFASLGSGAQFVIVTSGGAITSISSVSIPGSGYAVGDVLLVGAGSYDAFVRVTGLSGSGIASMQVLYGGTGYTNGATTAAVLAKIIAGPLTATITGTLTSNATFILTPLNYLSASRKMVINNNTTGNFNLSIFLSNGAGGTIGNGVKVPQGSNNSTATWLQSDGTNDIWFVGANAQTIQNTTFNTPAIIASGFGIGSVLVGATTAAFQVTVGASPGSTGVLTLPTAKNGWACNASNVTSDSSLTISPSAQSTTSVTFTSHGRGNGGPVTAFNASDVLTFHCLAF